jgi:hypothetical protein
MGPSFSLQYPSPQNCKTSISLSCFFGFKAPKFWGCSVVWDNPLSCFYDPSEQAMWMGDFNVFYFIGPRSNKSYRNWIKVQELQTWPNSARVEQPFATQGLVSEHLESGQSLSVCRSPMYLLLNIWWNFLVFRFLASSMIVVGGSSRML